MKFLVTKVPLTPAHSEQASDAAELQARTRRSSNVRISRTYNDVNQVLHSRV